jgi:hypothetical protein
MQDDTVDNGDTKTLKLRVAVARLDTALASSLSTTPFRLVVIISLLT